MGKENRATDPIPEEFSSLEQAAEFWDTHDTADYDDAFTDARIDVDLRGRRFEIAIDEDVMDRLRREARKTHLRPGRLASRLLRKELATSAR